MEEDGETPGFSMAVDAGVHFWCACGRSGHPPFCDGSHKGTGIQPVRKELVARSTVRWTVADHKVRFHEAEPPKPSQAPDV